MGAQTGEEKPRAIADCSFLPSLQLSRVCWAALHHTHTRTDTTHHSSGLVSPTLRPTYVSCFSVMYSQPSGEHHSCTKAASGMSSAALRAGLVYDAAAVLASRPPLS